MKKKVLCLAMAAAMSVGMSTSAFAARVGSGNVDGSDVGVNGLTSNDAAMILQYTLDDSFTGTDEYSFNLDEANYDGDSKPNGEDRITANDATWLLQDVLYMSSYVALDVSLGETDPLEFSVDVTNDKKIIDVVDEILLTDNYKNEINAKLPQLNSTVDKISFGQNGKTTTIRTDLGWSKFKAAVEDLVADEAAFDSLKVGDTRYQDIEEIRNVYKTAQQAVPSGYVTADKLDSTIDKVAAITGSTDMATVTVYSKDEDGKVVSETTYNLKEAAQIALDNKFADYNTVTIGDLQNAFGNDFVINAKNPKSESGSTYTASIKIERRNY
jgi:hypothetical protein